MSFSPRLVMVSVPHVSVAREIAFALLQKRLAACVNILPAMESHYWWQGDLHKADEHLILIKSSAAQFEAHSNVIREQGFYECPEIVSVAPDNIAPAYRAWWEAESGGG